MLPGMSKQLVYAFPGFYNKETICSNNLKTNSDSTRSCCLVWLWIGKKKGKGKLLWFGKQTIWFVTCVGKKPFLSGILYDQGSNPDSGN